MPRCNESHRFLHCSATVKEQIKAREVRIELPAQERSLQEQRRGKICYGLRSARLATAQSRHQRKRNHNLRHSTDAPPDREKPAPITYPCQNSIGASNLMTVWNATPSHLAHPAETVAFWSLRAA
jgi:hypothetical protein